MTDQAGGPPEGWYPEPGTGRMRWWSGSTWGAYEARPSWEHPTPPPAPPGNGIAIAALVLGVWGMLTTWIPLFIGLFLGLVPDVLAIAFGVVGITRANRLGGRGLVPAIIGLVLGTIAFASIFFGAGTTW
ncbi:DUF4190 domain-containing protein [Agromyces sp. SYSU T00194]|uniref:DUF4190 domain-containing protein n=1 Tax=Agromyces chitinivorans TaxID=3158560 RepID=UPI0033948B69